MKQSFVNVAGIHIGLECPVRIMGVINLSPESFYKDSVVVGTREIEQKVAKFVDEGVDIIDIGGASTAPKEIYGTSEISESEELKRITDAIETITSITTLPLSIDTVSSRVAERALELGVSIINDVSGLQADPEMAKITSKQGAPIVLMAHCKNPCASVQASLVSLKKSLKVAVTAGVKKNRILLDPGIGFGKPSQVDCELLDNLPAFTELGYPILVGVSRKAFIGELLQQANPSDRLLGSIAATALAVYGGASVIRTHDVKETRIAVRIGEAVRRKAETKVHL